MKPKQPKERARKDPPASVPDPPVTPVYVQTAAAPGLHTPTPADVVMGEWAVPPGPQPTDPDAKVPLFDQFKVREVTHLKLAKLETNMAGEEFSFEFRQRFAPWTTEAILVEQLTTPEEPTMRLECTAWNGTTVLAVREVNLAESPTLQRAPAPMDIAGALVGPEPGKAKERSKIESPHRVAGGTLETLKIADGEILVPRGLSAREAEIYVAREQGRREGMAQFKPLYDAALQMGAASGLAVAEGARAILKETAEMTARAERLQVDLAQERANRFTREVQHAQEVQRHIQMYDDSRSRWRKEELELNNKVFFLTAENARVLRDLEAMQEHMNSYEKLLFETVNSYALPSIEALAKKFGIEPRKILQRPNPAAPAPTAAAPAASPAAPNGGTAP
jgi:hypothetical protein